ncbi:MAG: plastocyanin/azurin family copper-binding protein [Bacteroidota bacterium]
MVKTYIIAFFLLATAWLYGQESAYYAIETLPIPEGIVLEVGGMVFLPDGQLAVCSRRGEIWIIKDPYASSADRSNWMRYAHGLHEPLGLNYKDGSFFATQRGELTKMTDRNGDGKADLYETIASWPLSGNYHDYSYGPVFMPNGNMLVSLNLSWIGYGASLVKWRGWMLEITEEGEVFPHSTGFRSPSSYGYNGEGDLFYSDNQGDWVGSGRITHVEKGDFVGNPQGLKWADDPDSPIELRFEMFEDSMGTLYEAAQKMEGLKPPTVWLPHGTFGISTSSLLLEDTKGAFGPFSGQMLVGDQGQSMIMRLFLEKIDGEYQGAIFKMREGFSSGVLRTIWGPDDKTLFVGMTNRGWSSTGKAPFGIQRMTWTGKTPFDMHRIEARSDGFEIFFTEPVNARIAGNPANYGITSFTYAYYQTYGSDPKLVQNCPVTSVSLSQDGMSARLLVEGLRKGFVHEIDVEKIPNRAGRRIMHPKAYYTLNQIPGGGSTMAESGESVSSKSETTAKYQTEMPASWTDGPDQTIIMGTLPGMKYEKDLLEAKAGSKIKFVFNNNDDLQHNFTLVKQGTADDVGQAAIDMGIAGPEKDYVPDSDDVLYHTSLLDPETSETIYFVAPEKPGLYQYVCTMPGHHVVMRGVFQVTK